MNREGHCFDPTIYVGERVKLNPKLYWWQQGHRSGVVVKIAGIFAYVNLGHKVAAIHMVDLLPA